MIAICSLARRHPLLVSLIVTAIAIGFAAGGSSHGLERCLEALAAACLLAELAMMPLLRRMITVLSRLAHFASLAAEEGSARGRHPAPRLPRIDVVPQSVRLQV